MEFFRYFILAVIALFAIAVSSAEDPPKCNFRFSPGTIVTNLAEGEFHARSNNLVQERPTGMHYHNHYVVMPKYLEFEILINNST